MSNNKSDSENDDISGPRPRLCHLRKWPHFQGYGFNLHAEKTRNGQSIGKVDPNSPAESAGLKEKDRIIEVNFVNISNENHQQVVKRIRCGLEINGQLSENEVVLLVVDPEADEYYKKRNIVVKHDFKNVLKLETPSEEAYLNNNNNNSNNNNNTKLLPPDSSPHVSSHRNSVSSTSEHNNSTEINNNNFDKTSNDYRYTNTNTSQNNEKVSTPLSQDKSLNYEKVSPPQTPLSTKSNGSVSSSNKDTQSNKSSSTTNTMNNNNNNHHSSNNANPFNSRGRRTSRTSDRYDEDYPSFTAQPKNVEFTLKDPNATPKLASGRDNTSCSNLVSLAFKGKAIEAVHQMLDATSTNNHDNNKHDEHHHLNKKENSFLSNLSHLHITTPKPKKKTDTNNSHSNLPSSYSSASLANGHHSSYNSTSSAASFNRQYAPNESRLNDVVFNMSAAEYKAYLKSNKPKSDPRSVHVDIKQKYQIFQNM